jgi:hypothetical protein
VTWRKNHFENLATFFILVSPAGFVLRTYLESGVVLLMRAKHAPTITYFLDFPDRYLTNISISAKRLNT